MKSVVWLALIGMGLSGTTANAALVVPAQAGAPFDIVVTRSDPDQYAVGHITYFFSLLVRPNMTNNEVDAFSAEFTASSILQAGSTIFAAPSSASFNLADSQFNFDPDGVQSINDSESGTNLLGQFFLDPPTEPYITDTRTFAHVVIPSAAQGAADILVTYIQNGQSQHVLTADFGSFTFDSVGTAVPEAGVILFWLAASSIAGLFGIRRKLRRTPLQPAIKA